MKKDGEEKDSRRKDKVVFLKGGGEAKTPGKMDALYVSVRSWSTEKEESIPFQTWKGVDKYCEPVYPT